MHPGIDLAVVTCCYICHGLLSSSEFLGLLHPELKQDVLARVYHPIAWEIKAGVLLNRGLQAVPATCSQWTKWKSPNQRVIEKNNLLPPLCPQWNPVLLPYLAVVTKAQTLHCRLSSCPGHSATKSWDASLVIKLGDDNLWKKNKQTKTMN